MRRCVAALMVIAPPALAASPATVRLPTAPTRAPAEMRLLPLDDRSRPALRIDDPRSPLRWGFGGAMVDLFPVAGGKFHISGGPRLFGRTGRRRPTEPESLRLLPAFRSGARPARRFSPALLVGYGQTVERGFAFGLDAGLVMGRIIQTPDRPGRLNRARADAGFGRGRQARDNELVRITALYRF